MASTTGSAQVGGCGAGVVRRRHPVRCGGGAGGPVLGAVRRGRGEGASGSGTPPPPSGPSEAQLAKARKRRVAKEEKIRAAVERARAREERWGLRGGAEGRGGWVHRAPAFGPALPPRAAGAGEAQGFAVVGFYLYTRVEDPEAEADRQARFMRENGLDIAGRIYVAREGINAQLSAPVEDAEAYVAFLRDTPGGVYDGLEVKWDATELAEHAFARLRLRVKERLVPLGDRALQGLAGGDIDLTDPATPKPTPLSADAWAAMLETVRGVGGGAKEAADREGEAAGGGRETVVLDMRNGVEWDVGHFEGAKRPDEESFRAFHPDMISDLKGKDPKDVRVMMFCTGGIRCEAFGSVMKAQGYDEVYTLDGGVIKYGQTRPSADRWVGRLFVFDDRMAVPVGSSASSHPLQHASGGGAAPPPRAVAVCALCGGAAEERHRNCANADCNKLFLACAPCAEAELGCCGDPACVGSPRRRPLDPATNRYNTRYARLHHYVQQP